MKMLMKGYNNIIPGSRSRNKYRRANINKDKSQFRGRSSSTSSLHYTSKSLVKRDVKRKVAKTAKQGQAIQQSAKSSAEVVKSFAEKTKEATKNL